MGRVGGGGRRAVVGRRVKGHEEERGAVCLEREGDGEGGTVCVCLCVRALVRVCMRLPVCVCVCIGNNKHRGTNV